MTVIEPTVYPLNMQEGVTASVPTVAAENVQMLVHVACRPIRKLFAVGAHTKAPTDASCAALVMVPKHPPIVRTALPATKVSGAPTVRVPTAAVRKPVAVLIAVTATGADCVVTWKFPAEGLIAYRAVVPNEAPVVGHAGDPPPFPAAKVKVPVPTLLKATGWNATGVPKSAALTVIVFADANADRATALGATVNPVVYPLNMQEGVTASVPTVAAENVQMLVHAACRPIWKVVAVGVPHTKAPNDSSCAALVIPVHPPIVRTAVPAQKVSGAPTERVPTAAVRKPVAVLIAVTATGADWVVT